MLTVWKSCISPLANDRLAAFEEHLLRLTDDVRARRFGRAMSDDELRAHCRRSFASGTVLVCTLEDTVRAAAEILPCDDTGHVVEAAFSVEPAWQGQGIGTALMHAVIGAACARGARGIIVQCAALNHHMQTLAARFEARMLFADGAYVGRIKVADRAVENETTRDAA